MNTRSPAMPPINPTAPVGHITEVAPDSFAAQIGVQPGDGLLKVNGELVEDVIDVQFFAADDHVALTVQRGEDVITLSGERDALQLLGLSFEHPTFDTDIRRCNNLCPFCFVLQMPRPSDGGHRLRRTLSIKDDDYRYSFLFGHYVTLTNLNEHDWQRILGQYLSPLFVSVHATDLEARQACLGNNNIPDILAQLRELGEHGIEVHTQLVITPDLNDGAIMAQSVADLAALWPTVQSVSIVPVGLTKHHRYGRRIHTRQEMEVVLDQCAVWQADFMAQFGVNFVYPTDEWYLVTERPLPSLDAYDDLDDLQENGLGMVRHFLDEWESVQANELAELQPTMSYVTLATAALFAPVLRQSTAELASLAGVQIDVAAIRNERLGETITVSGLLMAQDIMTQLEAQPLGDLIVLPRITFDHPEGISLDDVHPQDIANRFQRPVALADLMGDIVDILAGKAALRFEPA